MSDYTPTTERVRDTWTNAMSEGLASEEELADATWDTQLRDAQFDRWLASHDADIARATVVLFVEAQANGRDVRAGVVAEEPEWHTERQRHWCNPSCPDGCERWDEFSERRVTAWVPVKQEGTQS